jgi:uncharacterized membrane protein
MGVLLGIAAGILLGVSDFMANRASRTISSASVSRTNLFISGLIAPLLLFIKPVEWRLKDVVIATLAGIAISSGLILLYKGYTIARMGIVAPTASVLLAAVPVFYDLIQGHSPSKLAACGMVLGLAALVLTTYERGGMGSVRIGIFLGVGAGLLFGIGFTMVAETSDAAGLSPVLIQRVSGLLFLLALQRFDKAPILALRIPARKWAVGSGVAGGLALGALKLGYIRGTAGPVSVAASQFAAVAVLMSVIFNKERLRTWQAVGVVASGVGVALMALG